MTNVVAPVDARYITWADLKAMTEFPSVSSKTSAQLDLFVDRAHEAVRGYGPFEDHSMPAYFAASMRIALFLTAEGMALANSTRPAAAAGLTSETIGKYTYSLAPGGGKSGVAKTVSLVPDEAVDILQFWCTVDPQVVVLDTTHVFDTCPVFAPGDPDTRIVTSAEWSRLAPYVGLDATTGYYIRGG